MQKKNYSIKDVESNFNQVMIYFINIQEMD